MLNNKYLIGVFNAYGYINGQLVMRGEALVQSGMELTSSNTEIRSGWGNGLDKIFYHTSGLSVSVESAAWDLLALELATGAVSASGSNRWMKEALTVAAGGTVTPTKTPIAVGGGATAYANVVYEGRKYNCAFNGTTIDVSTTGASTGSTVCVGYIYSESTDVNITIPANFAPKTLHLFLQGQLASNKEGTGIVGTTDVEIPLAQAQGQMSLSLTADGYSTVPLAFNALKYEEGCEGAKYAIISEHLTDEVWYNGAQLAVADANNFTLATTTGKRTLQVYCIKEGRSYLLNNADLTFTSGTVAKATVGEHTGVVTGVASGTSVITIKPNVSGVTTPSTTVTVTVPA